MLANKVCEKSAVCLQFSRKQLVQHAYLHCCDIAVVPVIFYSYRSQEILCTQTITFCTYSSNDRLVWCVYMRVRASETRRETWWTLAVSKISMLHILAQYAVYMDINLSFIVFLNSSMHVLRLFQVDVGLSVKV